ncbi:MAG: tetratricopeptide repeat protein [Chloroflexota bacterium]
MSISLPDFDSLWDYNQPAETEKKFHDLLPAAETSGDKSYQAELLTQIARTQGLQGKFAEAHETLDSVETMLMPTLIRAKIRYELERGRVFNSSGEKAKAHPLFLQAWEDAVQAGEDFYAIDAAHMIAIVEPPERQMEWNLKAVEIAEKTDDERARNWLGSLYNNIGWTYHDAGQYEEALTTFQKALAYREQQGKADTIRIAKWCIGRALRSLNRIDEALRLQRGLLAEMGNQNPDGFVYEELGECLFIQGSEDASHYFALAYEALSHDAYLVENEAARLARLKTLGGI